MRREISLIGFPMGWTDAWAAAAGAWDARLESVFARRIEKDLGVSRVFLLDSGTACFLAILRALKTRHGREIVLPAYTASSLIVAILQEGFTPVLADVSLEDLGGDVEAMRAAVTPQTAAVLVVDMFGMPSAVARARDRFPKNVLFIEDACQAFGAERDARLAGTFGDVGFWSFNRGKNFPTVSGGCLVTDDDAWAGRIASVTGSWVPPGRIATLKTWFKALGTVAVYDPRLYPAVKGWASRFKGYDTSSRIEGKTMGALRASLGMGLWDRRVLSFQRCHDNAVKVREALAREEGVRLMTPDKASRPVFMRLPLLVDDPLRLARIQTAFTRAGIEISRFYGRPLHHVFDLGYPREAFPNAVYVAEHLLTVPVHASVTAADVDRMIDMIRRSA